MPYASPPPHAASVLQQKPSGGGFGGNSMRMEGRALQALSARLRVAGGLGGRAVLDLAERVQTKTQGAGTPVAVLGGAAKALQQVGQWLLRAYFHANYETATIRL